MSILSQIIRIFPENEFTSIRHKFIIFNGPMQDAIKVRSVTGIADMSHEHKLLRSLPLQSWLSIKQEANNYSTFLETFVLFWSFLPPIPLLLDAMKMRA